MVSCFLVVALLASSFGAGCAEGYCGSVECQANVLNATQVSLEADVELLQALAKAERAVQFTIVVQLKLTPLTGSSKASINTWAAANVDAFKTTVQNTFVARSLPCGLPNSLGTLAQLTQNENSVLQPTVFITVTGLPKCNNAADFESKTLLRDAMDLAITNLVATAPTLLYIDMQAPVYKDGDETNGGASSGLDDEGNTTAASNPNPAPAPAGAPGSAAPAPGPAMGAMTGGSAPPTAAVEAGKGDPHLVNLRGQHFDLQQPGVHAMIVIPAFAEKNGALLYVQALVEKKGSKCTDMYFTMINVTGRWVGAQGPNGTDAGTSVQYFAERSQEDIAWTRYGKVSLKVVWGRTPEGFKYLNLLAKNLAHAGYVVGGLLGEDDHTEAATPIPGCRKTGDV